MAPGTIDDAMWPLLGRKLQVVGKALDGHATGSATGKPYPRLSRCQGSVAGEFDDCVMVSAMSHDLCGLAQGCATCNLPGCAAGVAIARTEWLWHET